MHTPTHLEDIRKAVESRTLDGLLDEALGPWLGTLVAHHGAEKVAMHLESWANRARRREAVQSKPWRGARWRRR